MGKNMVNTIYPSIWKCFSLTKVLVNSSLVMDRTIRENLRIMKSWDKEHGILHRHEIPILVISIMVIYLSFFLHRSLCNWVDL